MVLVPLTQPFSVISAFTKRAAWLTACSPVPCCVALWLQPLAKAGLSGKGLRVNLVGVVFAEQILQVLLHQLGYSRAGGLFYCHHQPQRLLVPAFVHMRANKAVVYGEALGHGRSETGRAINISPHLAWRLAHPAVHGLLCSWIGDEEIIAFGCHGSHLTTRGRFF